MINSKFQIFGGQQIFVPTPGSPRKRVAENVLLDLLRCAFKLTFPLSKACELEHVLLVHLLLCLLGRFGKLHQSAHFGGHDLYLVRQVPHFILFERN